MTELSPVPPDPTAGPPALVDPKTEVLAHRATLRAINRRWNVRVGLVLGGWVTIATAIGLIMGAGAVTVLGPWLFALEIAALLSPVALIALTAISRRAKAQRMALAMGSAQPKPLSGLSPGLLAFAQTTRVTRVALSDAADHQEAVHQLWEWLRSLDALGDADAAEARARSIAAGPIGSLLRSGHEESPDLGDNEIARSVAHLAHVEGLLGLPENRLYR